MIKFNDAWNDNETIELEDWEVNAITWTDIGIIIENADGLYFLTREIHTM